MPLNEREVLDALAERQDASRVLSRWGGLRTQYHQFQVDLEKVQRVYRDEVSMEWPDGTLELGGLNVPNMVYLSARDRAREVSATPPQVVCRPDGPSDEAREKADKLERITTSWLENDRVPGWKSQMWAMDGMSCGLMVAKVLPDFKAAPKERFPCFTRLEPAFSYPDPVFSPGPFLDSFMYSYEDYRRTVEARYGLELAWKRNNPRETSGEKVRVIEYYDETWVLVVVEALTPGAGNKKPYQMVLEERHKLSHTPVVISATAHMDGTYRGEFINGLSVLEYHHRLMTLVMDDAIRKVYSPKVGFDIVNPQDDGPDAYIEKEHEKSSIEYLQNPNQPFSNLQVLRDVSGAVRTSFMLPPSRSGDPNESIISAAGVSATQSQFTGDVRSIQRDLLAPLLEAGMELALEAEEVWTPGVTKSIWSEGTSGYRETYRPSKDIGGYRKVKVSFGPMPGLDPLNQNVLVMQAFGNKLLDRRTAMELSSLVEDPQRVEKRQMRDRLTDAMLVGLEQQAAQGVLDPVVLSLIIEATQSDEVTLEEAVAALMTQAPLAAQAQTAQAAPVASAPGVRSTTPGIAGAATGPQPEQLAGLTGIA